MYIREPLFPVQRKFGLALTGKDPFKWSTRYLEGHAFWGKGCFSGKVKISLLNGTELSFEECYKKYKNKQFWVYSRDKNGNIVAGKAANPRITKYVKKLIEVKLDNCKKDICTLDHLYLLRDNTYKKAKDLVKGD